MKQLLILFVCIVSSMSQSVFASRVPTVIDGMYENDFILDEMLPNPAVYLYGTDSNGYPVLLMDFSLTIPIYAIDDNPLLRPFQKMARYVPFFHKKIKSLKFVSMYLKIEPTCNGKDGKNFYYKILKLKCDSKSQNIGYVDEHTLDITLEPEYNGMKGGHISNILKSTKTYNSELPIITYSGVGSDTLKIMLKRGRKYKIPCGHIDASMVVLAIPDYCPPLKYKETSGNKDYKSYVNDFMDVVDCANCNGEEMHSMRNIYFGKYYWDNSIMNYYEITPCNNPNNVVLNSAVIRGNRINQVPINPSNNVSNEVKKVFERGCCIPKCEGDGCCNPNFACNTNNNTTGTASGNCSKITKKKKSKAKVVNTACCCNRKEIAETQNNTGVQTDEDLLNGDVPNPTKYVTIGKPFTHTTTRKVTSEFVTKGQVLDDSAFMPTSVLESSPASEDSKAKDLYSISVKQFAAASKDSDDGKSKNGK